jgi:hypothetical protein
LQREFFADAGRGSGDEDGFAVEKGMCAGHFPLQPPAGAKIR